MEQHTYIVVLITAKDAEAAEKIGKTLVKRRQAACVNIIPEVSSHFWWKDKLDSSKECLLVVKTRDTLLPEIIKSVKNICRHHLFYIRYVTWRGNANLKGCLMGNVVLSFKTKNPHIFYGQLQIENY